MFLQHGIIKGDLSPWLNRKRIDLLVTSTQAEHDYISGESPYGLTSKEVRLTGLPRHDALLRKADALVAREVRDVLIAPTWREYLVGRALKSSTERARNDGFMSSEYATAWQAVLRHPRLRTWAREHGYRLVFMPHPNVQPYLDEFDLPDSVVVARYGVTDVQDAVARSALLITDYSSMAFNFAYLGRPTCYFQFDKAEYDASHTEGPAYYDYDRDGFGPVVKDVDQLLAALERLSADPAEAERYRALTRRTFPVRDGANSARVYEAITQLDNRTPRSSAFLAARPDSWSEVAGSALAVAGVGPQPPHADSAAGEADDREIGVPGAERELAGDLRP